MHNYHFSILGLAGTPVGSMILGFEDDLTAIRHALGPAFPHGCDVWRDHRLLGRFCGPTPSQTEASATARAA